MTKEAPKMTQGVEILPLQKEDLAACATCHQHSFSRPWTQKDLETYYDRESVMGFARWFSEGALPNPQKAPQSNLGGFLLGMICGDRFEILTLAVNSAWRRQGVAHALIRHVIHFCHAQNLKCIDLEVSVENKPAIKLYEKMGFILEGRRKNYFTESDYRRIDASLYRLLTA